MKKIFSILIVAILGLAEIATAQNGVRASYKTDINIVSVNDMHATIDNMPKLAAIVDSLRAMDKSLMVISAVSDMGDAREELECETEGPELAISFNVKYLTEFARVSAGEELTMRFGNAISPCVITQGDGEFIYLVLPVRTNAQ